MVMLESLKKSFDHGDYDDFGKLLSELHRLHYLDIEKYVKLIEHLSTYIIEEHENDGCDSYVSKKSIAYCAINLIMIRLRLNFARGIYQIHESNSYCPDSCDEIYDANTGKYIEVSALSDVLRKIKESDEYGEYADFTEDLKMIIDNDYSGLNLQANLLSVIDYQNPLLIMHILYFLRNVKNEDELKELERINLNEYTAECLKKEIYRANTDVYCHSFLDVASDEEKNGMRKALSKMDTEESPKKLILAISEQDLWLGKWMTSSPKLPYSIYKVLSDPTYKVELFADVEYDETNVVESADMLRKGFAEIIPKALLGDAETQHELGVKYVNLSDSTVHRKKAEYWLGRAADNGLTKSQIVLGALLYQDGKIDEALEQYRKAAEAGVDEAQYRLGTAYADGIGVEQDIAEAKKWLSLAADQGHYIASIKLEQINS